MRRIHLHRWRHGCDRDPGTLRQRLRLLFPQFKSNVVSAIWFAFGHYSLLFMRLVAGDHQLDCPLSAKSQEWFLTLLLERTFRFQSRQ